MFSNLLLKSGRPCNSKYWSWFAFVSPMSTESFLGGKGGLSGVCCFCGRGGLLLGSPLSTFTGFLNGLLVLLMVE